MSFFLAKGFPLELDAVSDEAILFSGSMVFGGGPEMKHLGTLPSRVAINRGAKTFDEIQSVDGVAVPSVEKPAWLKCWGDIYALNTCVSESEFRDFLSWVVPLSDRDGWCFRASVYVGKFESSRGAADEEEFLNGAGIYGDLFGIQALRREDAD